MAKTCSIVIGAFLLSTVLMACGPKQTNKPIYQDPDGNMQSANGLFYDMPPVDDRLSSETGDTNDWRYLIIPKSGQLEIIVNVDNPNMSGAWYLQDPEGRIIHSEQFTPTQNGFYQLASRPVEPGKYHLRVTSEKGTSVYTVGAQFKADPEPVAVAPPDPPEEKVEEDDDDDKKKRRRRKRRDDDDDKKKERKKKPEKEEAEDAGVQAQGNTTVTGSITLATELEDGSVEVTIRGVGKANGVKKGMTGNVKGLGVKVKTTSCKTTKCYGVVKGASARDLRSNSDVAFKVP